MSYHNVRRDRASEWVKACSAVLLAYTIIAVTLGALIVAFLQ